MSIKFLFIVLICVFGVACSGPKGPAKAEQAQQTKPTQPERPSETPPGPSTPQPGEQPGEEPEQDKSLVAHKLLEAVKAGDLSSISELLEDLCKDDSNCTNFQVTFKNLEDPKAQALLKRLKWKTHVLNVADIKKSPIDKIKAAIVEEVEHPEVIVPEKPQEIAGYLWTLARQHAAQPLNYVQTTAAQVTEATKDALGAAHEGLTRAVAKTAHDVSAAAVTGASAAVAKAIKPDQVQVWAGQTAEEIGKGLWKGVWPDRPSNEQMMAQKIIHEITFFKFPKAELKALLEITEAHHIDAVELFKTLEKVPGMIKKALYDHPKDLRAALKEVHRKQVNLVNNLLKAIKAGNSEDAMIYEEAICYWDSNPNTCEMFDDALKLAQADLGPVVTALQARIYSLGYWTINLYAGWHNYYKRDVIRDAVVSEAGKNKR